MSGTADIPQPGGLEPLVAHFDLFLLDQFGVMHDGEAPYPDAVATLARLQQLGARVVVISNSGRRAAFNLHRLARLGFEPELVNAMVTSGEVAREWLATAAASASRSRPYRCFVVTGYTEDLPVEGLPLEVVDEPVSADLVLICGADNANLSEHDYRDRLTPAARAGVPCLCTNPDRLSLAPEGLRYGPGRVAEIYQELGGDVQWIGKPHAAIYRQAMALFPEIPPARTLCIGDSVEHDIVGARSAGLASALVRTGILAANSPQELHAAYARHGAAPDFILPALRF